MTRWSSITVMYDDMIFNMVMVWWWDINYCEVWRGDLQHGNDVMNLIWLATVQSLLCDGIIYLFCIDNTLKISDWNKMILYHSIFIIIIIIIIISAPRMIKSVCWSKRITNILNNNNNNHYHNINNSVPAINLKLCLVHKSSKSDRWKRWNKDNMARMKECSAQT